MSCAGEGYSIARPNQRLDTRGASSPAFEPAWRTCGCDYCADEREWRRREFGKVVDPVPADGEV